MVEQVATKKAIIAKEAAVAKYWSEYDELVNTRIEKAVAKGKCTCRVKLEDIPYHIYTPVAKSLKKHFKDLGYRVFYSGRYAEYKYIRISWRNEQSQKRYRWYNPFGW